MEIKNNNYVSNFFKLYDKAIDESGNPKNCGREICKELINTANNLDSSTEYGNINTGMMNISKINTLYSILLDNRT